METYKSEIINGQPTITTTAVCTHQQGSWKWQVRLCTVAYCAVYSAKCKAWLWKSTGQIGVCFSGGNIRHQHTRADGSKHNERLTALELAALGTLLGESYQGEW